MSFKNNIPHVEFEINKEMDYWAVKEFLSFDPNDSFNNGILAMYPELKKAEGLSSEEKTTLIHGIVDSEYERVNTILDERKPQIQNDWNKVEDSFLEATIKLFKGHAWHTGSYIGFLSIFNCNPRLLNQKAFQVYYKHEEDPVYVCAHEMLHFMFYDYVDQHKELVPGLAEEQLWKLSEIFNVVVLETKEFSDITGNANPKVYKSHEVLIPKFREILRASKDCDDFVLQGASKLR